MNEIIKTNLPIIITILVIWLLIVVLLCRWAYKRKGALGVLAIIFGGIFGVLLLPSDDKDKK